MDKAEDIQFHLWNTTYIFTAVKYNLYFHCSENTTFYIFTAVKYSLFLNKQYI